MCTLSENSACHILVQTINVMKILLTRVHGRNSRVGLLGEAQFVCAEVVGMAAHTNHRMLHYVAILGCELAVVPLDCCMLMTTIGHLPGERLSRQPAARSYCYRCDFGCSGINLHLPAWVTRGLDLAVVTIAAGGCCSPVVGPHIPAAGTHTAVVYQNPVLEPVVVDSGMQTVGVA